ncbi:MAG: class I SAM-dependent methyltransferase [Nitrospiraceae bacterium]|nr:class I SAM-dependent methyltransferase [Nitrospiraceae bacterium]
MNDRLTDQAYWEYAHQGRKWARYMPDPGKYRSHYELDRLFKSVLERGNKKILELGAGSSIWLPYFAKEFGFEPYGIDYSKKGCDAAEQNLRLAGVKGHIFCRDFFDMGDEWDGFFDVMVSFGVVEHFENPAGVIKLMRRLLKPGGIMITVVPNTKGLIFSLASVIDRSVVETHKSFSLYDLSCYHQKAGLKIQTSAYLQFLDLSMLNFDSRFSGPVLSRFPVIHKLVLRAITGVNMPFLYLQKLTGLSLQSGQWCSTMAVTAVKGGLPAKGKK